MCSFGYMLIVNPLTYEGIDQLSLSFLISVYLTTFGFCDLLILLFLSLFFSDVVQ